MAKPSQPNALPFKAMRPACQLPQFEGQEGERNAALPCRDKWLFKPALSPEAMGPCEEVARVSQLEARPFGWSPQEPSQFEFEMVQGVIRVFHGSQRQEEAFPVPGTSYDFFSDMHW